MKTRSVVPWLAAAIVVGTMGGHVTDTILSADRFDHTAHAKLFPTCVGCHSGVVDSTRSIWPTAVSCVDCHDGDIAQRVTWQPPTELPHTNLTFDHGEHAVALVSEGREPAVCIECHSQRVAEWMSVSLSVVGQCLACHGIDTEHLSAPASTCADCHVTLARAERLTVDDISTLPSPPSHDEIAFATTGRHGLLARDSLVWGPGEGIAASCATCHARDFCVQCHVDAPEQPSIVALETDARSLVHSAELQEPETHTGTEFLVLHGTEAMTPAPGCRTCHTRESCLTCHIATPGVADGMHAAGTGRSQGAQVERSSPASHGMSFVDRHGPDAALAPDGCAGCHAREDCLACHRPDAGDAPPGYHGITFLSRHPVAAYVRETDCSNCHNTRAFCASCHVQAGLTANGPLSSGYHDAKRAFTAGHGQAARQNLESCVTCHTERDCVACHSAVAGRRISPHGPGFDAARLRKRNPEMCTACHGTRIP